MSRLSNLRKGTVSVLKYLRDGLSASPICLQLNPEERMMFNCLLPMPFENRRIFEEGQIYEAPVYESDILTSSNKSKIKE